jgi:hypothetical protein
MGHFALLMTPLHELHRSPAHLGGPQSLLGTVLILIFFVVALVMITLAIRLQRHPEFQRPTEPSDRGGANAAAEPGTTRAHRAREAHRC